MQEQIERLVKRAVSMGYKEEKAQRLATLFVSQGGLGACIQEPEEFSISSGRRNFFDVILEEGMMF